MITLGVTSAYANWRQAITTIHAEDILSRAQLRGISEEQKAEALVAPLLSAFGQASLSIDRSTSTHGVRALQIAAQAASEWRNSTTNNIVRSPDAELEAFAGRLPKEHEVSPAMFAQRLRDALAKLQSTQ